jgi:CubicO group peptidase (beta-lactamase class C family)
MKRLFFLCVVAGAFSCGKIEPNVSVGDPSDPRFAKILAAIEDDMSHHGVPGAAIAIVDGGKLAFAAGVGTKKRGETDPIDATTLFRVDSLSKMVTAMTTLSLVEEGKLDLHAPVTTYVPLSLASPWDPSSIALFDLLTHTSGIPDISVNTTICPTGEGQMSAWFAAHGSQSLYSPPTAVWDYTNQGFGVVGWAIETVTGEPFEQVAAERVFAKANMTTATYDVDGVVASHGNYALGHTSSKSLEPTFYDCAVTRPPGGVIANVLDYAHLAETLFADDGSMLDSSSISALETGHVDTDRLPGGQDQYAFGLETVDGYKGLHIVMHTGSDEGYRSVFMTVPASKLAIIIFYNAGARSPSEVATRALDVMLGLENLPQPVVTTSPNTWGKYAGTYVDPNHFGSIAVTLDDSLSFTSSQTGKVALKQVAGDEFYATVDKTTVDVTFYPGTDGTPQWFVTRSGVGARQN